MAAGHYPARTVVLHIPFDLTPSGASTTGTPSVRWRVNVSHCINCSWRNVAMGHFLPRRFVAVVAAVPLITDTKAINRRDRFGPIAY
jgi:hypothetical protein